MMENISDECNGNRGFPVLEKELQEKASQRTEEEQKTKKKRKTDGAESERKWKKRAEKQGHKDRISHHYREKERWFSGFVSLILST